MLLKKLDFNFYLYAANEYDIMKPLSLGTAIAMSNFIVQAEFMVPWGIKIYMVFGICFCRED